MNVLGVLRRTLGVLLDIGGPRPSQTAAQNSNYPDRGPEALTELTDDIWSRNSLSEHDIL